jgi:hypothetical protein
MKMEIQQGRKQFYTLQLITNSFLLKLTNQYIILFFLLIAFQSMVGQDLSYIQYTEKDGLPSSKTYDIVQDSTGLLWVGTENGLVSFDEDEFVTYTHPDLLDNDIIEVVINQNGRVYFLNLSEQLGYIEEEKMVFIETKGQFDRIINLYSRNDKTFVITLVDRKNSIFEFRELLNKKFKFIETDIFIIDPDGNGDYSREGKNKFVRELDSTILGVDFPYRGTLSSQQEKTTQESEL